jgi:hypothetical protein
MRIQILDQAELDLSEGSKFYEDQEPGLGWYFLTNLYADIESLRIHAGVHRKAYKHYHRLLSRRFPFAVFFTPWRRTPFFYSCSAGLSQRPRLWSLTDL